MITRSRVDLSPARGLPIVGLFLLLVVACGAPSEHGVHSASHDGDVSHEESSASTSAAGESAGELTVHHARATLMPGMGAVYLSVDNSTAAEDRLLSISSSLGEVSLHETVDNEGVLSMEERADGFPIPAGASLELAPGGKHGMLMGAEAPPETETIELTLEFESAGTMSVEAAVVEPAEAMAGHDEH